jgi:hypothetical protein
LLVAEPQGDLGLEKLRAQIRAVRIAGRQIVRADSEALAELAEDLKRRDTSACLDPGYIGGRAALERELTLREAGGLTRVPQATTDRGGMVYVA